MFQLFSLIGFNSQIWKKKHPSNEWSRKARRNLPVVGQPPLLPPVIWSCKNRGNRWKPLQFGKELILLGWFSQPMRKVCNRQNGFIFFNFRGERRTYLKSPTSYRWRFHQDRFETTKGVGQKFPEISGSSQLKALEVDKSQVLSESWASPKIDASQKWLPEMSSFQCWSLVRDPEWLRCGTVWRSSRLSNDRKLPKS